VSKYIPQTQLHVRTMYSALMKHVPSSRVLPQCFRAIGSLLIMISRQAQVLAMLMHKITQSDNPTPSPIPCTTNRSGCGGSPAVRHMTAVMTAEGYCPPAC
jgi:hypothetical protein